MFKIFKSIFGFGKPDTKSFLDDVACCYATMGFRAKCDTFIDPQHKTCCPVAAATLAATNGQRTELFTNFCAVNYNLHHIFLDGLIVGFDNSYTLDLMAYETKHFQDGYKLGQELRKKYISQ